jgi:phage shock protein C
MPCITVTLILCVRAKVFSHTFIGQRTKFFSMKHLYRSKKDRILGGVCAGLGEHLDIDPNIIRLIWAVVTLLSFGTGILVYIFAWIIIPEQGTDDAVLPPQELDEYR